MQHLIFSSLLHGARTSNGRLTHIPHFDSKADIEQYIRDSGVPSTFYMPGYFMSNLEQGIRPSQDGVLTWALPISKDSKFPLIDIKNDTGEFVVLMPSVYILIQQQANSSKPSSRTDLPYWERAFSAHRATTLEPRSWTSLLE